MRLLPALLLLACTTDVHVQTLGTEQTPLQVSVHDVSGALLFTESTGPNGDALLRDVPKDSVVTVTAEHNDPVTYIWSQSVVGVRPGDELMLEDVVPWDPDPDPPAESPEVTLTVGELPTGGVSLWLGLFECGLGPFDDPQTTRISLGQCSGPATPVAIALNGGGLPVAFQALATQELDELAGQRLVFEGPWRMDWDVVRLDVEGPAVTPVVATMQMGRWFHYELHQSTPFTVPFLVPPGLDLIGLVSVSTQVEQDRVVFEWDAEAGDAVVARLDEAVMASGAELEVLDSGYALTASVDAEVESLGLTVVSVVDQLSYAWEVRMPADGDTGVVLPSGFVEPLGFADGYGLLEAKDDTRRGYGSVRETGVGGVVRRERAVPVSLPR